MAAGTDKRDVIIAAALDVLGDEGYAGFTQPRVAARAGLRQSHLTYYFPTRLALLEAVAEVAIDRRVAAVTALANEADAGRRLATLAEILASAEQTRVLLALVQAADKEPTIREKFARFVDTMSAFGKGQFEGHARAGELATLLHATSVGLAVVTLSRGGAAGAGQVTAALSLLYRLLATAELGPTTPAPTSSKSDSGGKL